MKAIRFKKVKYTGWFFRVGSPDWEIRIRYFSKRNGYVVRGGERFRVIICLNTDKLINMFGFNQKSFEF